MALGRKKDDDAPEQSGGGVALAERNAPGPNLDECMAAGQALVQANYLTAEQLAQLLTDANGDLFKFSEYAISRNRVGRNELAHAVAAACQVPAADSNVGQLDPEVVQKLSEQVCREHKVIAVAEGPEGLIVYAVDPSALRRQQVEAAAGGQRLSWRASDHNTVTSFIEQMFRNSSNLDAILSTFAGEDEQRMAAEKTIAEVSLDDQSPVVQLVAKIVGQALRDRTSDIHIEPLDDRLRIRYRVDGQLIEAFSLPLTAHNALVSRLKIMSEMNIVEKRAPQDGQFSTKVDGKDLDVRVSSVATVFGEKIVMRLLDKSKSMVGLSELGMPKETYNTYAKLVHAPFGMVICAGPTGAGKTTTLYATLLEINNNGKNVTTVEDPVEYVFPGINQVQTNEKAGLTFATGLKALLRQDPDVILVGEIRDEPTARIAIQSALTGHFVLSSLHGTDAVAALHRLLDMGIEAFLVASAIVGVVSQRLIRKMCDNCKEQYELGPEELAVFRQHSGGSEKTVFWRGAGCTYCSMTGYRDRIGIYELLRITPEIRRLIVGWATTEELRRLAVAQGMRTMLREAIQLVEDDTTTVSEVVRTLFAH
ncbi:MAG: ATPase, T2SS/T4P/T4SS family [Ilumatobacter sp.]|uniref:GspE/PulE family protein n=1 Tax=Ilumatobacter sp. TaxID=1967498 RepID=UPI0032971933